MKYLLFLGAVFFQLMVNATPQAFFNYKIFYTPDEKPYLVTSLQFSGGTYKYKYTGEGLQANVEITHIFKSGDSIVFF